MISWFIVFKVVGDCYPSSSGSRSLNFFVCHLLRRQTQLQSTTFGACWACQGWNVAWSSWTLCHPQCLQVRHHPQRLQVRRAHYSHHGGSHQHHHGVPLACGVALASGMVASGVVACGAPLARGVALACGVPLACGDIPWSAVSVQPQRCCRRRFALSVPPQRCYWRRFVAVCKGCWNATGWRSFMIIIQSDRTWMRRWLKLGVLLCQCGFFLQILGVYIFSWFPDAKILWW